MKWLFLIKGALRTLYVNKRKSLLSIGALSIGIISVLLVLGFGNGVNYSISQQLVDSTGGENAFKINYISEDNTGFSETDLENVSKLSGVANVKTTTNPDISTLHFINTSDGKSESGSYAEISDQYLNAKSNIQIVEGANLNSSAYLGNLTIAIKDNFAKKLFSNLEIDKKTLTIKDNVYQIASVYSGTEEIPDVLMSSDTFSKINAYRPYKNQMTISCRDNKKKVQKDVLHFLENYGTNAHVGIYQVEDMSSVVEQINKTTSIVTNLIACVAGISLVVAGFGVMSSTYSSIAERAEEIGLRRAFGATKNNVRNQFVAEGVILAIFSAFISLIMVIIIGQILGDSIGIRLIITKENMLIAILIPTLVGIVFSYIPATFAARKNVLDLLKK